MGYETKWELPLSLESAARVYDWESLRAMFRSKMLKAILPFATARSMSAREGTSTKRWRRSSSAELSGSPVRFNSSNGHLPYCLPGSAPRFRGTCVICSLKNPKLQKKVSTFCYGCEQASAERVFLCVQPHKEESRNFFWEYHTLKNLPIACAGPPQGPN